MDQKYNRIALELNTKIERLRESENNILNLFQKTIQDFSSTVRFMKREREELHKQLEEISGNRLKTFEKIREELKIIKVHERKNEKLSIRLKELEEKEAEAKNEYNALLSGMYTKPKGIESSEKFYNIYESNKKLKKFTILFKKDDLVKKKENFLDHLKTSFEKLESGLIVIEKQKNKIKQGITDILNKIHTSNLSHSELQKQYTKQIRQIKKLKKSIKRACMDEASIMSDYHRFLTHISSAINIPKEVSIKLLPILSRIEEEKEWTVEVEEIPISGGKLIEFPKTG